MGPRRYHEEREGRARTASIMLYPSSGAEKGRVLWEESVYSLSQVDKRDSEFD